MRPITEDTICLMSQTALRASSVFADSKPHYEILDGLRGTAALLVVAYHIFEGLAFAAGADTVQVNSPESASVSDSQVAKCTSRTAAHEAVV